MVIFLRTAHFVLVAVDLVILTAMFLKVPSEGKGLGGLELILDPTIGVRRNSRVVFICISLWMMKLLVKCARSSMVSFVHWC